MAASTGSVVMNELQQLQLRAQILVYGALLQRELPEEQLMVGAFSDTSIENTWNDGRHLWERSWLKAKEVFRKEGLPDIATSTALVPFMPTAVRSALNPVQAAPPSNDEMDVDEAGERKKRKLLGKDSNDWHDDPQEKRQELDMQQVKRYVKNADSVVSSVSSIIERAESLRAQFQGRTNYGQMVSLTIALEAALSAARAAVVAASLAHEAVQRFTSTGTRDCLEVDEGSCEEISCALGNVFKAVSQAQTALRVDNPRQLCTSWRRGDGQLNGGHNQMDSALLAEGATVEVMARRPGAWFTAKVLSVKDGTAQVSYNDLFDEGSNHVTEWVSSDLRSCRPPKIRFPYPSFDLNEEHDEEPKHWTVGDHIDARVGHAWREGIIVCVKSDDVEVFYPSEGAVDIVKSCDIRPSLLWQGDKWALWKCLELEKEAASSPDFEIVAEHAAEQNHKMSKPTDAVSDDENSKRLGASKRVRGHSSLPNKVSKAKRLFETSSFQLPGPMRKVTTSAPSPQMLKQLARMESSPKRSSLNVHPEEPRFIQPSTKLLEELKTALQGGIL